MNWIYYAFNANTGQKGIFKSLTKFLMEGIMEGYNATVFVSGITSSGKAYTILATGANPGIIFLTWKELFIKIKVKRSNHKYDIRVSFLEIYNEMIRDLIVASEDVLGLREDRDKNICIDGLYKIICSTWDVSHCAFDGNNEFFNNIIEPIERHMCCLEYDTNDQINYTTTLNKETILNKLKSMPESIVTVD